MTYRQLKEELENLDDDQLDSDLTIVIVSKEGAEIFPITGYTGDWEVADMADDMYVGEVEGILDDNHPYFLLDHKGFTYDS